MNEWKLFLETRSGLSRRDARGIGQLLPVCQLKHKLCLQLHTLPDLFHLPKTVCTQLFVYLFPN